MRCLLAIPVLAGLMFPPLVSAQLRSASARPHGVARAAEQRGASRAVRNFISAVSQPQVISKAGGAFSVVSPFRVETRSPWMEPAPAPGLGRAFSQHRSHRQEFLYPSPFGYPFISPGAYDPSMFYPSLWLPLNQQYLQARQIAHGDVAGEVSSQQNEMLRNQVQALSSEIESLRQGAARQAPAASRAVPARKTLPTVFVYRDGRSFEARNYAIFNETLWVFGAQTTRRIPLSAINLPATLKLNEDRGVDVSLPGRP